jgi:hypothetical protein
MIIHRVALHKFTRDKLGNRYADELHLFEVDSILFVVGKTDRGFECILKSGIYEERLLPDDHPYVLRYLDDLEKADRIEVDGFPVLPISQWIATMAWCDEEACAAIANEVTSGRLTVLDVDEVK